MNLVEIFNQLNSTQSYPAVSIFISTHRTFPDNQVDAIALKNAIKEAENRLLDDDSLDKQDVQSILNQIEKVTIDHDHNYNLDSLAIFATSDNVQKIKFPFKVEPRVTLDQTFATRDLLREINHSVHYYILVISRTHGRLLEVFNDELVHEFTHDDEIQGLKFPIENNHLYTTHSADRANASKEDNYLKEFLNRVDKSVQEVHRNNPLPIIIVGDDRNVGLYQQVTDNPKSIIDVVTNSANLDAEPRLIINDVQDVISQYHDQLELLAQNNISQARSQNLLIEDLSKIYRAANEGKINQIFIRKGYIQPAVVDEDTWHVDINEENNSLHTTDDVIDDILSIVVKHGGKAHFISTNNFPENANILAENRY